MVGTALRDTAKSWLESLGYPPQWLLEDYRLVSGEQSHVVDCVAFGSDTHDLASSCIAVEIRPLNGRVPPNHPMLRFLAPPVVWEVDSRRLRVWKMRPHDLEFKRDVAHAHVPSYLAQHRRTLSPREVLAAKTTGSLQLDLVDAGLLDAARDATAKVLYHEFHRTIRIARNEYRREIDNGELRRLIVGTLQIMTARAFEDKLGWSLDRARRDVAGLLKRVNRHVRQMLPTRAAMQLPAAVADRILQLLTNRVAFSSATPDLLSMIYLEPALEADERRVLGAYYTPRSVAEYIFSVLPVRDIPTADWFVLDPTCGSGNLLIAAYHALSSELADTPEARQRAMLHGRGYGVDNDDIACQASRAAMLLCSVPEASGWRVSRGDFFRASPDRLRLPQRPTVIVANPPFGAGNGVEERAALALRRSLQWLADGGLIGFIVPETFAIKPSSYDARADLLESCEVLDVLRLPRDIFPKSRAATQVICARKKRSLGTQYAWVQTVSVPDRKPFLEQGQKAISRRFRYPADAWRATDSKTLAATHLFEVWDEVHRLRLPPVCHVFTVTKGFRFQPGKRADAVLDQPATDAVPCICSASRLAQFRLTGPDEFVRLQFTDATQSQLDNMKSEKALIVRTSTAAIPWRISAACDMGERLPYQSFLYAIAKAAESPRLLVALLNSKVVNAWFYSFHPVRDVLVEDVKTIPWPSLSKSCARQLCELAESLQSFPDSEESNDDRLALIGEVDDLAYQAFRIGPAGRQLIEETFYGERRPGFGVERPLAGYQGRVIDSPPDPRAEGVYEVVGRVAYVDRGAQMVYCDLSAVAPDSLVAFPLKDFPTELATAGLSFEASARHAAGAEVEITKPRPIEFQGITYGEAYEMLAKA